ncbi:condensation domain-containing protein [Nocardia spumae]|uniref:condensation domain-containing protein n=1 Tax=Nocardia spumae TaxID=2887190 RepID=UPI001D13A90B|nr:condensation domain-containing protein [Nocardia spumae]
MSDSSVFNTAGPGAEPRSGGRGVPLSPAQQAALLPERLRGTPAANLSAALEITGDIDVTELGRAAVATLSRHEILRTVYPADRRIPYQRVADAPESVLEVVDLAPGDDLAAALRADAAHRFDLTADLPVRLRLYRSATGAVLSIAVHPIAADDRTVDVLIAELLGADTAAADSVRQYRAHALAQVKTLAGNAADDGELGYWLECLAGLPERAAVVVSSSGAGAGSDSAAGQDVPASARRTLRLPADVVAALTGAADLEAATTAVLATVLAEAGLGADVAVGIVDAGRADDAVAFGAYANYLVLRVDTASARTPRALVTAVSDLAVAARSHAGTRIERLTHQLRGAVAVADGVPFQALVNVRTEPTAGLSVRELERRVARPHGADIVVDIVTGDGDATVTVDFPAKMAGRPEIDAITQAFEQRFAQWAAAPDDSLPIGAGEVPTLFERFDAAYAGMTGLGGEPETDAERLLAEGIREVLDLDSDDPVGRSDTFFSLGGDSIAALRLVTLLGERGYTLDVQHVFEFPAVREMASRLVAAEPGQEQAAEPAAVAPMSASGLDPAALRAVAGKFAAR